MFLLQYPEVFTGGFFSKAGAERDALKGLTMKTTLVGRGWATPLSAPTDLHTAPPDSTKVLTVTCSHLFTVPSCTLFTIRRNEICVALQYISRNTLP